MRVFVVQSGELLIGVGANLKQASIIAEGFKGRKKDGRYGFQYYNHKIDRHADLPRECTLIKVFARNGAPEALNDLLITEMEVQE